MVEIKDIQDRETLKAWLDQVIEEKGEDEGRRIAVFIAHRTAMRMLPYYWRWTMTSEQARNLNLSAISLMRASLISGVAASSVIPPLSMAARAAREAAGAAARAAAHLAHTSIVERESERAHLARTAAADACNAVEAVHFDGRQASSAAANAADPPDFINEIRLDALIALSDDQKGAPLWLSGDNRLGFWAELKSATMSVPEGPTHWSFWRRWYDDAVKGGPPRNPELLKAVALIDPEDWDKGPAFINDVKIPELQAEHARHIASTAAEIVRDEATGAFTEVAVSDLEDGLFRDARERANEAIDDFRTFIDRPQSPYGAFAEDLDVIETQIVRAADRPIRCYENLADAMLVILDIAKYNGLETDSRVTRLVREFERSRRDLRADDDKIAAREAKRIRIGYDELMDAEQEDFRAMLVGFAEKSDETLEEEMKEDEAAIASPETLEGVRDRALLRSSERMLQMDGIEKEEAKRTSLEDVGKKADAVNKVAKAGETGANVIVKVSEWFLGWV